MQICFLMYDSRSGSTLISALLNRYRDISVSHETGFIPIVLEFDKEISSSERLDELVSMIAHEVQYRELGVAHDKVVQALKSLTFPVTKKQVIDTILDVYFSGRDNQAVVRVVKSPRLFFHLDTLRLIYPDVKFIHIIRDGRGVFNSKRSMVSLNGIKTQSNLIKAAFEWKRKMQKSVGLGDRVIEVSYENLLSKPDEALNVVLDYLGINESGREMTKEQSDYSSSIGDRQKHLHENVQKRPDNSRANKWMTTLRSSDIALYEIIAGRALNVRGYKLANEGISWKSLLRPDILFRAFYYVLHQLVIYARNMWWYVFVDRSIKQKVKSKLYEFRSDR